MSQPLPMKPQFSPTRSMIAVALALGIALFALSGVRRSAPAVRRVEAERGPIATKEDGEPTWAPKQMVGAEARRYLQQPGEGQSLMQAITAARFGLQSQERGPFGETGAGYLGMSHDQNLNAWFAEDGPTLRPTVAEAERERSWHLDMRLKAYGYGNDLAAAPPIVSHQVKGNRIEYERAADFELRIANFELQETSLLNPQSQIRNPKFLEWYENRAEGIEQGFTISARPERNSAVAVDEPLRLVVSLQGDLRARGDEEGRAVELTDASGKRALSYSRLTALDAVGKQLTAHMEASSAGTEIALVVDDRDASYPIVIDPIVASLEKILDAGINRQAGGQFGDAVAIDGDRAVVGSWFADSPVAVNSGAVYFFTRTGSTWSSAFGTAPTQAQSNSECGYSVAIGNGRAAFGCPGANGNAGRAFVFDFSTQQRVELVATLSAGDFFGASVAIGPGDSGSNVVVGAPSVAREGKTNVGSVFSFVVDSGLNPGPPRNIITTVAVQDGYFGSGVALDSETTILGMPGANEAIDLTHETFMRANDSSPGDLFGQSLAISGDTAVISAPGDDDKGTDAGAAYVLVRDANGNWSQQQKLTASDGKANDSFSYFSVAIEGNTIVVGARRQDLTSSNPNDNSGAAYIFTRNGAVWTQQAKLSAGGFYRAPGDEFGTSVGISGDTVIVSAPHEAATDGTANSGVTYVYRLDCVPPSNAIVLLPGNPFPGSSKTVCPGAGATFIVANSGTATSYQWRKDGTNIPGATAATYFIPNVSASDAGSYDVFVSNSCGGEFSNPATLSIHSFSLNPSSQNISASGSNGIVNVTSTGSCAWTAVSNSPSFITVTSGASGSGNGTVNFTVAANTGANQRTGTINIAGKTFSVTQDGTGGTLVSNVQFSAINYSAGEGGNNATITVTRTGDTSGTVTVDFATSDLVAQQRTDYTITAGTLTFTPGQTSRTLDVLIVDDLYVEGSETLNLTLSNPTGGAVLGSPSTAVLTITDNDASTASTNPLDNADQRFFVRQHFYDFLSRLPDQGGFDFWVGQITQCGSNQTCVKNKRLDVSNAFFFELEYQQTGAYVVRLYRAAFGNNQPFPNPDISNLTESKKLPSYAVFARDRAHVVGGTSLAQSQLDLANAFAGRAEFLAKYSATQDGPTFVDAILATIKNDTGADLASQRTALINLFNSGGRGAVLYRLADDNISTNPINNRAFIDAEYNRAFVATQYFGYLRRDSDIGGFLFWVGQVNSGPLRDTTKQHAMVCAFVTSAEYQQRFSSVVTHNNGECQ